MSKRLDGVDREKFQNGEGLSESIVEKHEDQDDQEERKDTECGDAIDPVEFGASFRTLIVFIANEQVVSERFTTLGALAGESEASEAIFALGATGIYREGLGHRQNRKWRREQVQVESADVEA
ncbi:hypothetical protein KS4_29640 [Poriferisphaera corsica]|uniref:Uncharacterized protein n=1 Tax=Poriferisphaera corsica TaxID=2528020 RepID=A0A517YXD6_9BACT|nr:hypothetical protein [Poriferisphaera corsica]QDU34888.1 hypothetical protein KS4_29640 [Poriferisphaera corsica]